MIMGSLLVGSVRPRGWIDNHSPKVSLKLHFATHSQAKFECVQREVPPPRKICKYNNDGTKKISYTLFPQLILGLPTDKQFEVLYFKVAAVSV